MYMPGLNDDLIRSAIDDRRRRLLADAGKREPIVVSTMRRATGALVIRLGERLQGPDRPAIRTPAAGRLVLR